MRLNLIMPMAGGGTRFGNHGFELPKPLIPIYGKPFFYWATRSIEKYVKLNSITFVVLQDHVDRFKIDEEIKKYYPDAKILKIPDVLPGAVLTCQVGADTVPDNEPILFNDCDHLFVCREFYDFCEKESFNDYEGVLLTFKSDENRFSFVAYGEDGLVNRTVEKEVISNDAICGAYYFKNKQTFISATEEYLTKCSYNEFFVSGVYNIMASHGKKIASMNTDVHVSFGTPDEYENAQTDKNYMALD